MNALRTAIFISIDLILFISAYISGMYRSLFFTELFLNITSLPIFTTVRSLLILVVMSLPILLVMFLINQKWLQLYLKTVIAAHVALVLTIWGVLELII